MGWLPPQKLKAIRLLGKQPLQAATDDQVASVFLACHVIKPHFKYAFQELRCEMHERQFAVHKVSLEPATGRLKPADKSAARAVLLEIVDAAVTRLRAIEAERLKADGEVRRKECAAAEVRRGQNG